MTISRIASAAGVGVETIRYYQRRGLIAEPPKPQSRFRRYPAEPVNRLRFIKRTQESGFTLSEVETPLVLGAGYRPRLYMSFVLDELSKRHCEALVHVVNPYAGQS